MRQMPRDSLSLAIRVGCEVHGIRVLSALFKLLDDIRLVLHIDILRLKIIVHINAELRLRQVDDMPRGRHDLIARAQVFLNCFRL